MKINIDNKSDLNIKKISEIIEPYLDKELRYGNDYYIEIYKNYKLTIELKKTIYKITVEKIDILAKKISKKGLNLPKM